MESYPYVIDEQATLQLVIHGVSLARFGDGEFHLCEGHAAKRQRSDPTLRRRLRAILSYSGDRLCLVGVPNILSDTPKWWFWHPFERMAQLMTAAPYGSAFITRPDSAPWIDNRPYWAALESLWLSQDVTLVRGSTKSLTAADLVGARNVREIVAPARDAWSGYEALLEDIGHPARALLCLGPTATVLAYDLAAKGVHAVDLGHCGMFLRKHRQGLPMTVTAEDKCA